MFCPKCGKELPDDSVFCNACGHQLNETTKSEPAVEEKPKKEKKPVNKKAVKTAAIISGTVIGIAAIFCIVFFIVIPSLAHSKAEKLYNDNQYIEAYQAYIDAYRKPMNGNVDEEEITNCGFAVIDEYIKNGDAESAFRFMHQYSKDSTMEGGWIINDTIYKLRDRRSTVVTDPAIQKKICDSILQILSSDEYCRFDTNNINAYTEQPLFEHDILLLKYILLALPIDDESFILPHEICEKIIPLYIECANSEYYNDFKKQYLFTAEDAFQYVNIIMNTYLQNGDVPGLYEYFNEHPDIAEHFTDIVTMKYLPDVTDKDQQQALFNGVLAVLESDQYFTFNHDETIASWERGVLPWNIRLMDYILEGLPTDYAYGYVGKLQEFFSNIEPSHFRMHFLNNRQEVLELWELDVVREMLINCYDMIYILLGDDTWYLCSEKEDYGIDLDVYLKVEFEWGGSECIVLNWHYSSDGINIPNWVGASIKIENCILYFTFTDGVEAEVFRFEFSEEDPDVMYLYCYEDGKTLTMT